jgi:condensin complex subunit 3
MGTPAPNRMTPAVGDEDPEAKWKKVIIDIRCLEICISLLERVNSVRPRRANRSCSADVQPLHNNSVFHGLVPDLIIQSVRDKEEPALRELGMVALGLCCMIDLVCAAYLKSSER